MMVMVEVQEIPCNLCQAQDSEKLYEKGGLEIARCRQCGLVYANPRLTQEEIWQRYSPTYFWDEYMPAHNAPNGEFAAEWHRQRSQATLELLRPYQRNGRLLEVGCAAGFFLKIAQADGWQVQGVEIMTPAVEYGRQTLQLDIFEGTLTEALYADNTFDAVVLIETVEHLLDPADTLREVYRILRPGGAIWITVPNQNSIMRSLFGTDWSVMSPAEHLYYFTDKTLSRMLRRIGFQAVKVIGRLPGQSSVELMNPYHTNSPNSTRARLIRWGTKILGWLALPILLKSGRTDRLMILAEK